jgi:hypothetical protein
MPCRASSRHPEVLLLSRGRFPEGPRSGAPPCVFCSPALFSACSQHTGRRKTGFCVVVLPAMGAFQRPSAALAHSASSIIGLLPVFTCFPCAQSTQGCSFRFCSTYWVWRLRLRLPTPGLVGSPHVHMYIARAWARWASPVS